MSSGGGGGTFDDMSAVDAKIAAAEARSDTKFAELLGELKLINVRLDHVERTTGGMRSTVIGTGIGVVAVVIAVMAYGAQWFGVGMDAQAVADNAARSVVQTAQPQIDALNARYNEMNSKLDQLLQAVATPEPEGKPETQFAPFQQPRQ